MFNRFAFWRSRRSSRVSLWVSHSFPKHPKNQKNDLKASESCRPSTSHQAAPDAQQQHSRQWGQRLVHEEMLSSKGIDVWRRSPWISDDLGWSRMISGVDGAELTDSSLYDLYGPETCYSDMLWPLMNVHDLWYVFVKWIAKTFASSSSPHLPNIAESCGMVCLCLFMQHQPCGIACQSFYNRKFLRLTSYGWVRSPSRGERLCLCQCSAWTPHFRLQSFLVRMLCACCAHAWN